MSDKIRGEPGVEHVVLGPDAHALLSSLTLARKGGNNVGGPRRFRRLLVEADFAVLETRVVMHCPRLPAIAAGLLLQRRPGDHERFLAALGGFEALERLPTRSVTGYFVAARCTSYA